MEPICASRISGKNSPPWTRAEVHSIPTASGMTARLRRVLLVEPDVVIGRRARGLWVQNGFDVSLTSEFAGAAALASRWAPDVIVFDVEDREGEGKEFLLQLRSRAVTCRIPVVLYSRRAKRAVSATLSETIRLLVDGPCETVPAPITELKVLTA